MFSDKNFSDIACLKRIDPTASATVYGRRPKFVRAKHLATAEGEKCGYGPTQFIFIFLHLLYYLHFSPLLNTNLSQKQISAYNTNSKKGWKHSAK